VSQKCQFTANNESDRMLMFATAEKSK